MKKLNLWIGVDADGSAWAYRLKPEWNAKIGGGSFFQQESDVTPVLVLGKNKAHAGKCWQQEIAPPAKKRGSAPSSEPQTEWWDNRK